MDEERNYNGCTMAMRIQEQVTGLQTSDQLLDTQSAQSSLTGKLSKEADPSPAHVRSCIHGSSAEKALPQCVQSPFQHFGGYRSVKMLRRSKI